MRFIARCQFPLAVAIVMGSVAVSVAIARHFYSYWQEMGGSPPRGQTWENTFEIGVPPRAVVKEKWICLEVMVKMNDVDDTNGEQAYWLDGRLSRNQDGKITGHLGKGFPSVGTWTYDKFKPYVTGQGVTWDYRQGKGVSLEGGKPFPGFACRNTPELNINAVWLYRYMSKPETGASKVWWDHLVVAQEVHRPRDAGEPVRRGGLRGRCGGRSGFNYRAAHRETRSYQGSNI